MTGNPLKFLTPTICILCYWTRLLLAVAFGAMIGSTSIWWAAPFAIAAASVIVFKWTLRFVK